MDRLELEDLADQVVDKVQFDGHAVQHHVDDPSLFRQLLRQSARARSLHIRTGVATSDPKTVWAARRDDEWEFTNPVTDADLDAASEAMDRALCGTSDM